MTEINQNSLAEESTSVQIHLGILQNVIARMASNSASSKTWCITIVSTVLVIVADKGKSDFIILALIPIILFCALDTYYLAMEKGFRASYETFVGKIHRQSLTLEDLYLVKLEGNQIKLHIESLKSFSVWGFYVLVALLVIAVKFFGLV
ncbi:MAG: hypothetical protein WCG16_07060 [Methylococcales bacterium]